MTTAIKRELRIFIIVGLMTVAIDFAFYRSLLHLPLFGTENLNLAKGISFISGTLFAYIANRFWTFNQQPICSGSFSRFIAVYVLGLAANIAVNYLAITYLNVFFGTSEYNIILAFLLATSISASLNFIGMKYFVFTEHRGHTS
jgi:putative flippase GtrA